ncbi:hypothetical protein CAter282_4400 [Collimonas arenae]|uniref:Uncharacterized protein n=1 Tax=Collimonas arenae TaxID=279058 RepID=A0A127PWR3_9BURK|nr:hypothetical protein CAter10_4780 [Collimonas arenae]AMP12060.1 hypothetical protein CAter282_4400 [Collimonas arenae]
MNVNISNVLRASSEAFFQKIENASVKCAGVEQCRVDPSSWFMSR